MLSSSLTCVDGARGLSHAKDCFRFGERGRPRPQRLPIGMRLRGYESDPPCDAAAGADARCPERDRPGRTVRRPAEWSRDGSRPPTLASHRDPKRLWPEAKGSGRDARAPQNATAKGAHKVRRARSKISLDLIIAIRWTVPIVSALETGWETFLAGARSGVGRARRRLQRHQCLAKCVAGQLFPAWPGPGGSAPGSRQNRSVH